MEFAERVSSLRRGQGPPSLPANYLDFFGSASPAFLCLRGYSASKAERTGRHHSLERARHPRRHLVSCVS
ncbi:hypothetical protein BH18ACI4_BH18ACI4_21580 [soil metagenome]